MGAFLHCFILTFSIFYLQDVLDVLISLSYIIVILSTYVSTIINISLAVVRVSWGGGGRLADS